VRETGPETGAIDVVSAALRYVHLLTARTENLKSRSSWDVTDAHGEHLLLITQSAGAVAVAGTQELFKYFSLASRGVYISRMDQTIEVSRLLVKF
jgi:hypothetical protein